MVSVFDCFHNEVSQIHRTFHPLGKGIVNGEAHFQILFAMTADASTSSSVSLAKRLKATTTVCPEIAQVTDVFVKIAEAFLQSFHVRLLNAVEADTTVHLQSLCSGDDNGQLGLQTAFCGI